MGITGPAVVRCCGCFAHRAAGAGYESPGPAPEGWGSEVLAPRARSVIYIFLSGGLSQLESFDLKPKAPDEIRGEFQPSATGCPASISASTSRLAELATLDAGALADSSSNDHSAGHQIMLRAGLTCRPASKTPRRRLAVDCRYRRALTAPRNNLPPAVVLPEKLTHSRGVSFPESSPALGPPRDPWLIEASPFDPTSTVPIRISSSTTKSVRSPPSRAFPGTEPALPEDFAPGSPAVSAAAAHRPPAPRSTIGRTRALRPPPPGCRLTADRPRSRGLRRPTPSRRSRIVTAAMRSAGRC